MMATEEQIAGWLADLVYYERTMLPCDHPRRVNYGGGALTEVRRAAKNAAQRLKHWNRMPNTDKLRALAEGGVSVEQARRDRAREEFERRLDEARSAIGRLMQVAGDGPDGAQDAVIRATESLAGLGGAR